MTTVKVAISNDTRLETKALGHNEFRVALWHRGDCYSEVHIEGDLESLMRLAGAIISLVGDPVETGEVAA